VEIISLFSEAEELSAKCDRTRMQRMLRSADGRGSAFIRSNQWYPRSIFSGRPSPYGKPSILICLQGHRPKLESRYSGSESIPKIDKPMIQELIEEIIKQKLIN